MSREKQIEEMAKKLAESICWDEDEIPTVDCLETATRLYLAGYRKQSEGVGRDKCNGAVATFVHSGGSTCGYVYKYYRHPRINCLKSLPKYCPNCGTKMKAPN